MNHRMLEMLTKRWHWRRYQRQLDGITTVEQFNAFLNRVNEPVFRQYEKLDPLARQEIDAVLGQLGLDVCDKSVLDIGPGYGTTMDVVRERGAKCVEYAEYNPFFYTYNRLKGFCGYQLDVRRYLGRLPARKYDLIWIKATYVADAFIVRKSIFGYLRYRYPKLEVLLGQIDRLAAPGGMIIFCPHWMCKDGKKKHPGRSANLPSDGVSTARLRNHAPV